MSRRTHNTFIMAGDARAPGLLDSSGTDPAARRGFFMSPGSILEPPREPTQRAAWRPVGENGIDNTGAEDTGASKLKPENKTT